MIGWFPALNLLISLAGPGAVFLLKTRIEAGIQFRFEREAEALRSELRSREAEMSASLDKVLSGAANRQAILDARRLKASEAVWASVGSLKKLWSISSLMSTLNISEVAKVAERDPKMREFATMFLKTVPENLGDNGFTERPFISEPAWAYLSAYSWILRLSVIVLKLIEAGAGKIDQVIDLAAANRVLKTALPHQSDYIDKYGLSGFHHLLEELEGLVLRELKRMLDGEEANEADVKRASNLITKLDEYEAERRKRSFENAMPD